MTMTDPDHRGSQEDSQQRQRVRDSDDTVAGARAERDQGQPETLARLLEKVPMGWTRVISEGRPYGLSRTERVDGRSVSILAQELGGPDVVSANVYRVKGADLLRACEMPDAKVLAFLRGWSSV